MKLSHVCLSVALVFFSNSVFSASTTLCSPGDYIFFGNGSTINTVDGTINNPYPLYVFTYKNTQLSPTPYYFGKPYDNYGSIPLFGYQDYTSSQTAYYAYVQNTATGQWYRYGVTTASGVLTPTSDMPLSSFHGSLSGPGASPQNVCTLALGTSVFQRTTQPAGATPLMPSIDQSPSSIKHHTTVFKSVKPVLHLIPVQIPLMRKGIIPIVRFACQALCFKLPVGQEAQQYSQMI